MGRTNYLQGRNNFYEAMDRRGVIEYTTGNTDFDEQIATKWYVGRPKEENFSARYSEEEIRRDLAEINRIENSPTYQQERSPVSALAEVAVVEGINRGLLCSGCLADITSRFDDIKSGVDVIVTMPHPQDPEECFVFGLDVTVSDDEDVLDKKASSEFIKLEKKQRTKLKYYKGLSEPINRYVIGLPAEQIKNLADILLGKIKDPEEENLIKEELADELINEARWQAAFVLLKYRLIDENLAENLDAFMAFLGDAENQQKIKSRLTPTLSEGVLANYFIITALRAEQAKKKKEDSQITNPPTLSGQVDFLSHFRPKQLAGLRRAA